MGSGRKDEVKNQAEVEVLSELSSVASFHRCYWSFLSICGLVSMADTIWCDDCKV